MGDPVTISLAASVMAALLAYACWELFCVDHGAQPDYQMEPWAEMATGGLGAAVCKAAAASRFSLVKTMATAHHVRAHQRSTWTSSLLNFGCYMRESKYFLVARTRRPDLMGASYMREPTDPTSWGLTSGNS